MIFWVVATFLAYFVKGLCGFANTLVFDGVMGLSADISAVTPTEVFLSYPANMIMAFKERKRINWKLCIFMAVLIVAGGIPGAWFLKNASGTIVRVICGLVIAALGIEMLFREKSRITFKNSRAGMVLFGLICGVMCGAYGIGAILGAYLTRTSGDTHEFKANLNMVFTFENTFRIINYFLMGLLTLEAFIRALYLLPVMVAGIFAGMFTSKFLNEAIAKKVVICVLILSGAVLAISNL